LAEIAQRPTMLYHIPSRTGVALDLDTVARLAAIPHVAGVKFTDHNLFLLQGMRRQQGDDFLIMSGADEMMVPSKLMGSTGTIGSWYNIIPHVFIDAFELAERGEWDAAAERQNFANALISRNIGPQLIGLCKVALAEMGIDVGRPRQPLPQIDDNARKAFITELQDGGYLE
jgi:N-acetylneuraminate lyase